MALARWKDLCLDATTPADPQPVARFWADVLELALEERDDGVTSLRGDPAERTTWVNPVPEPKTVKNRVHLDVRIELDRLLELGATVLRSPDAEISWHLCADPGGNEFCVFAPADGRPIGFYELVVDTADPQAQADWWAGVLGGTSGADPVHPWCWVEALPGAPFEYLVFTPVPEPKTVKNRIHLDVTTTDLDELVSAGASVLRPQDDEIGWTVLADPDGNEFCAFVTAAR
jgi:hypothetical protein